MGDAPYPLLLGRGEELGSAVDFLQAAPGGPGVLLVDGEAGIGKTTLWLAGVAEARVRGFTVLECRCVEAELRLPFTALADLCTDLGPEAMAGLPQPQRAALTLALRGTDPGPAALHRRALDPRALGTALLAVLRVLSAHGPVLLAADDAPWMDDASARAVTFAVRRLRDEPVRLLLTRRIPVAGTGLGCDALLTDDLVQRLHLGPLAPDDLARLLYVRLRMEVSLSEARRLHDACGGNAFLALETVRAAGDRISRAGEAVRVPGSLQRAVTDRLGRQPGQIRRMLLLLASASKPTISLVTAALPGPDGGFPALADAVDEGLVVTDGDRVRFSHPLLANAAYWDATAAQRRAVHAQLAALVAEPEERARHLALAATGADEEIAGVLDDAARIMQARGAPEHAAGLSELACQLTPPGLAQRRRRRMTDAAERHFQAGDGRRAADLLEQVVAGCAPGPERAAALTLFARIRYHDDSVVSAVSSLQQALPESAGDPALQTVIHRDLGWAWASCASLGPALSHVQAARELCNRQDDPALVASVLAVGTVVRFLAGQGADFAALDRAMALQPGHPFVPFDALSCKAQVLKWTDRFAESRRAYVELRHRLSAHGDEGSLPFVLFQHGELECWAGEWDVAAQLARQGRGLATLTAQRSHIALCGYVLALVHAHRGLVDQARAGAEDVLALSDQEMSFQLWAQTLLGFLELSLGDAAAAHRRLAPFADLAGATGLREPGVMRFVPDEIEALVTLGDLGTARMMTEEFEARGRELDRPYARATGARCRGLVAAAGGRQAEALIAFAEALTEHERLPAPFERGRTLLARGVALRRGKQRGAARTSLEEALSIFRQLGAALWSARARGELVRLGARGAAPTELTPTERRVAELVATGRTNREVADVLFLSVKTVEVNLSRIYRKLGVRSRTELVGRWTTAERM